MSTCSPAAPQQRFSCPTALNEALQAYHSLMVGQTKVRVRHGESEVEYNKRDIPALRQYIMSLHQSCGNSASAAVLGIPSRRAPGVPVFGNSKVEPDCAMAGVQQQCTDCGEGC